MKTPDHPFRTTVVRVSAFTVVEVLVVIAIIGIFIGLLLPAIQAARESSHRSACSNNLHQLALACKAHEEAHQSFPTGGWGANWVGDPDAGFGPKQPGGWIYNVLPYIEENQLRELGHNQATAAKRAALSDLLPKPIAILNCPTRRPSQAFPYHGPIPLQNADPPLNVAKSDYTISGEISYVKSEVIVAEIQRKRGTSKTVLLGEKSVAQQHYQDGHASGDMLAMYVGDSDDIRRSVTGSPLEDTEGGMGFGSAHSGGCNVAMCDGSVQFIATSETLQP
jgi:prepilin-type processing-associated H-X9-DG protein